MTPLEARKLWTDALRSGEYSQGKGHLCATRKGETQYCCLGVACEVYQKNVRPLETSDIDNLKFFEGEGGVLPEIVAEWLDVTKSGQFEIANDEERIPSLPQSSIFNHLTRMNDDCGKSFNEIADLIDNRTFTQFKGM